MASVVVIGGGIVGLCSAYFLKKDGHQVTVVDHSNGTDGCSYGNAGMVVPSHFIPLAAPGVIAQGLKWMMKSDSPFSIALNSLYSADDLAWLWRFYQAATDAHVARCGSALRDMNLYSRQLLEDMCHPNRLNESMGRRGLLMLYKTVAGERHELALAKKARNYRLRISVLNHHQVQALEPDVRVDVRGAVHYLNDSHVDSASLMASLQRWLKNAGIKIRNQSLVIGFEQKPTGEILSIRVNQQGREPQLFGDEFVLSAGVESQRVASLLAIRLPMMGGRGYSLTLNNAKRMNRIPAIMTEAKATITPMGAAVRFAGTMELGARQTGVNRAKLSGLYRSIVRYYPDYEISALKRLPVWSGLRPCSPDGMPYIGRFSRHENLIAATGHSMMGMSLGPATGRWVADLVSGHQSKHINYNLVSPDR